MKISPIAHTVADEFVDYDLSWTAVLRWDLRSCPPNILKLFDLHLELFNLKVLGASDGENWVFDQDPPLMPSLTSGFAILHALPESFHGPTYIFLWTHPRKAPKPACLWVFFLNESTGSITNL